MALGPPRLELPPELLELVVRALLCDDPQADAQAVGRLATSSKALRQLVQAKYPAAPRHTLVGEPPTRLDADHALPQIKYRAPVGCLRDSALLCASSHARTRSRPCHYSYTPHSARPQSAYGPTYYCSNAQRSRCICLRRRRRSGCHGRATAPA